mmetsp:Transcript_92754/g.276663  ORF Transcript_92754/g.276663 Transcript_92754/m.276663 type:complete len:288 (+) Transcript_92754:1186-2049(+)
MGTSLTAYHVPSRRCRARQTRPKPPAARISTLSKVAARCPFRSEAASAASRGTRGAAPPVGRRISTRCRLTRLGAEALEASCTAFAEGLEPSGDLSLLVLQDAPPMDSLTSAPTASSRGSAGPWRASAKSPAFDRLCGCRDLTTLAPTDTSNASWARAAAVARTSATTVMRSDGCSPSRGVWAPPPCMAEKVAWPTVPAPGELQSCDQTKVPAAAPLHLAKQFRGAVRNSPARSTASAATSPAKTLVRVPRIIAARAPGQRELCGIAGGWQGGAGKCCSGQGGCLGA